MGSYKSKNERVDIMEFYNSLTFMLAFMILLVFTNMAFGSGFTEKFLLLVLASMLIFNVDKFEEITKGLSITN